MEMFALAVAVFAFILIKSGLQHRATTHRENMRLLEEALKSPVVDRATLETLTYQLTGRRPHREGGSGRIPALLLFAGWITMFVGGGMWLAGANGGFRGADEVESVGMVTLLIGLGVVSYPFALRELEARRAAQ